MNIHSAGLSCCLALLAPQKKIIKKTNTERQQGKRNVEERNAEIWFIIFI